MKQFPPFPKDDRLSLPECALFIVSLALAVGLCIATVYVICDVMRVGMLR